MAGSTDVRLPVTGTFAFPFALYYLWLAFRVGLQRLRQRVVLGDRVVASASATSEKPKPTGMDPLLQATRAQQNFNEYVPLALFLAATAELNGADPTWLTGILASLFGLRLLHAELGIMMPSGLGFGRPVGFYGTSIIMVWLGGWATWLALS
ncbi:membrane-associated, eicosanoid/glutathione metabolism protein [Hypomontagnella monticulosa]|nr:membrane-associated, eicosanoid/glutathione metabolism protein [Hypomontagnella monticulosa]